MDASGQLQGSLYSPFLHDAVIAYAMALNKTLTEGGNKTDGRTLMENSRGVQFHGICSKLCTKRICNIELLDKKYFYGRR